MPKHKPAKQAAVKIEANLMSRLDEAIDVEFSTAAHEQRVPRFTSKAGLVSLAVQRFLEELEHQGDATMNDVLHDIKVIA